MAEQLDKQEKKSVIVGDKLTKVINYSRKNKLTLLESATWLFDR